MSQEFPFLQYSLNYGEAHLGLDPLRHIIAEVLSKLNIPTPAQYLACTSMWTSLGGKIFTFINPNLHLAFLSAINLGNKTQKY